MPSKTFIKFSLHHPVRLMLLSNSCKFSHRAKCLSSSFLPTPPQYRGTSSAISVDLSESWNSTNHKTSYRRRPPSLSQSFGKFTYDDISIYNYKATSYRASAFNGYFAASSFFRTVSSLLIFFSIYQIIHTLALDSLFQRYRDFVWCGKFQFTYSQ